MTSPALRPGQEKTPVKKQTFWFNGSSDILVWLSLTAGYLLGLALNFLVAIIPALRHVLPISVFLIAALPPLAALGFIILRFWGRLTLSESGIQWRNPLGKVQVDWADVRGWVEVHDSVFSVPKVSVQDGVLRVPIHAAARLKLVRAALNHHLGNSDLPLPFVESEVKAPEASTVQGLLLVSGLAATIAANAARWMGLGELHSLLLMCISQPLAWICVIRWRRWFAPYQRCLILDREGLHVILGPGHESASTTYSEIESLTRSSAWIDAQPDSLDLGFRDHEGSRHTVAISEHLLNFEAMDSYVRSRIPKKAIVR